MHKKSLNWLFAGILGLFLGVQGVLAAEAGPNPAELLSPVCAVTPEVLARSPFAIRALHWQFQPNYSPVGGYERLMSRLAAHGYNVLIFGLATNQTSILTVNKPGEVALNGVTDDQMKSLVAEARAAGIEPVMEIKWLGKQKSVIGQLARKYPKLLVGQKTNWDVNTAFTFPDGRDVYQAIYFPILNHIISWYGDTPPKYLFLGMDELPTDPLAEIGKADGKSAAQVFADAVNHGAEYLLKRNITPIMWGDMLLSKDLARAGAVAGFEGDQRFDRWDPAYNARYPAVSATASVLSAVNLIQNRDKIIIGDWHYLPEPDGQFPSVDYFQAMGFKDVWPATFRQEINTQQFSRYGQKRHVGGMIETLWYVSAFPAWTAYLPPLVNNSALYFLNPELTPSETEVKWNVQSTAQEDTDILKGNWGTAFGPATKSVTVSVSQGSVQPVNPLIWLQDAASKQRIFASHYQTIKNRIDATVPLPAEVHDGNALYNLWIRYQDAKTGYMVQRKYLSALGFSATKAVLLGDVSDHALLAMDFSKASGAGSAAALPLMVAGGEYGAPLVVRQPQAGAFHDQALNCRALDAAIIHPLAGFWDAIAEKGMVLTMEVQLTGDLPKGTEDFVSLISYGDFGRGFRALVGHDRQIQVQFGRTAKDDRNPTRIISDTPLEKGKWTTLTVRLSPAKEDGTRTATVQVGDGPVQSSRLSKAIVAPPVDTPLGVGAEFRGPNHIQKAWPVFPGLIRSVRITTQQNQ